MAALSPMCDWPQLTKVWQRSWCPLPLKMAGARRCLLDHVAGARLMESCGANEVEELIGRGWEHVRDALTGAYNNMD